jgi:hypothetical protein
MFHGFDFDTTMLRIGSMNMLLHGVENPDIRYRDSLACVFRLMPGHSSGASRAGIPDHAGPAFRRMPGRSV